MPRLALEEDLFHPVAVTLDRTGHLRLQGRALWKSADCLQALFPKSFLIRGNLIGRFPLFVLRPPAKDRLVHLPHQIAVHHAAWCACLDLLVGDVQIIAADSRSAGQE
jgi:hypothetical protein